MVGDKPSDFNRNIRINQTTQKAVEDISPVWFLRQGKLQAIFYQFTDSMINNTVNVYHGIMHG